MKKLFRCLSIILVIACSLMVFTACNDNNDNDAPNAECVSVTGYQGYSIYTFRVLYKQSYFDNGILKPYIVYRISPTPSNGIWGGEVNEFGYYAQRIVNNDRTNATYSIVPNTYIYFEVRLNENCDNITLTIEDTGLSDAAAYDTYTIDLRGTFKTEP